ncbi:MAG: hypothetical protein MJE68_19235 [Proteobacteria bacterium]|nr:hypothetical protein [Pseudomonadota bacterium]
MGAEPPILRAQQPREHTEGLYFNIKYDGVLGEPDANPPSGVWFSATLYKGNIPTQTPYPTGEEHKVREKYWRVSLKTDNFNLLDDKVVLFRAKTTTMARSHSTQNSLVFIREEIPVIRNNCKQLDKWNNEYFWFDEAANCWMCPKRPIWTKIYLTWDIDLTNDVYPNMFWDRVPKVGGV